ncbi:hypothetical protein [Nocardia nepalensis]|uniref:hypothetical protein n=1 Tax=Nocardia nepalensis TaxID=3375448 RepID=UPI003B67D50B
MTDHPGWLRTDDDIHYRAVTSNDTGGLVTVGHDESHELWFQSGDVGICMETMAPKFLFGPDDLLAPLKEAGTVTRLANPSLWDALAAAIIRHAVPSSDARYRWQRLCRTHGEPVTRDGLTAWQFPSPDRMLALSATACADIGVSYPMPRLHAASHAYLDHGEQWTQLPAHQLVTALQTIPKLSPWTARVTVADYTNDFSHYPYTDTAIGQWARQLNPDREWPRAAPAFKTAWEQITGEQTSAWTMLTYAWGITHGQPIRRADQ